MLHPCEHMQPLSFGFVDMSSSDMHDGFFLQNKLRESSSIIFVRFRVMSCDND